MEMIILSHIICSNFQLYEELLKSSVIENADHPEYRKWLLEDRLKNNVILRFYTEHRYVFPTLKRLIAFSLNQPFYAFFQEANVQFPRALDNKAMPFIP